MPKDCIAFKETGYFSKLICDYLDESSSLNGLYGRFPNIDNFKAQIKEKKQAYKEETRKALFEPLEFQ